MSFKKFCPRCGKETDAIVRGTCQNCYLEKHELFSVKDISLPVCVKCGKLHHKNSWKLFSDDEVAEEVASKIKVDPDIADPKVDVEISKMGPFEYEARINVKGFLDDSLVEQEKFITFKLSKVSCDACMKLVSNYREGILQLRASSNEEAEDMYRLAKSLIEKEKANDSLSGIVKTMKNKNGYELWIGSKKAAAKVSKYMCKLYKVRVKTSKQLIGEDESGEFDYRYTFCIRR